MSEQFINFTRVKLLQEEEDFNNESSTSRICFPHILFQLIIFIFALQMVQTYLTFSDISHQRVKNKKVCLSFLFPCRLFASSSTVQTRGQGCTSDTSSPCCPSVSTFTLGSLYVSSQDRPQSKTRPGAHSNTHTLCCHLTKAHI